MGVYKRGAEFIRGRRDVRKREGKYWAADKLECFVCGWIYLSDVESRASRSSNKISSDPALSGHFAPALHITVSRSDFRLPSPLTFTQTVNPSNPANFAQKFRVSKRNKNRSPRIFEDAKYKCKIRGICYHGGIFKKFFFFFSFRARNGSFPKGYIYIHI